jgi:hypothetical protein
MELVMKSCNRDPVMSILEALRVNSFLNLLNGILTPFVA